MQRHAPAEQSRASGANPPERGAGGAHGTTDTQAGNGGADDAAEQARDGCREHRRTGRGAMAGWSIGSKILIACLSMTAVTLAFGLVSRDAQHQLGDLAVHIYDEEFMSMSYLRSAQIKMIVVTENLTSGDVNVDKLPGRIAEAVEDLGIAAKRARSPEARQAAESLRQRVQSISETYEGTHEVPNAATLEGIEASFETAVELNAGDGFKTRRTTGRIVGQLDRQNWAATGISVTFAVIATMMLSNTIVPGVRRAAQAAAAIAAGKLDNDIAVDGGGEIGVLLRALSTMQSAIRTHIARIQQLMDEQAQTHANQMESQTDRFETALDNMVQGLCMFGEDGRLMVHNHRFGEMFGAVAAGTHVDDALPAELNPDEREVATDGEARAFTKTLDGGRTFAITERRMKTGGWLATYEDVTERHRAEARMTFMARHDALTGLANRVLYHERMEQALTHVRRHGGGLALFYLDLDHFKAINDTLGHAVGDGLLVEVARRLGESTREGDTVARLGGDEFVIIQTQVEGAEEARDLADRLLHAMGRPFEILGHSLDMGISIGIAHTTHGIADPDTLLRNADLALYRSKEERGGYSFFDPEMDAAIQTKRLVETDLRSAIAGQHFENYYQPVLDARTRRLVGFEALVRWRHPTKGMIPPGDFLPVAEESGLIAAIGNMVLEQACLDAQLWPGKLRVAVNLSPLQFRNESLAMDVAEILHRTGLPPARLELEITESVMIRDDRTTLAILDEIKSMGIKVAMDDFGTGYSSLGYLRRFPFDKIKIDQSFVRNLMDGDDGSMAIVRAILSLGQSLRMDVVAEGIETEEQYRLLRESGCGQVQGYLFSRPVPIREAIEIAVEDVTVRA